VEEVRLRMTSLAEGLRRTRCRDGGWARLPRSVAGAQMVPFPLDRPAEFLGWYGLPTDMVTTARFIGASANPPRRAAVLAHARGA